jgi:tetratricopeptide (TPR) repeat protein
MPIPGQPPPSPALAAALEQFAAGQVEEGEQFLYDAARSTKAEYGSGSHPLARAYADLARYHYLTGEFKKAAAEFKHASGNPLPTDKGERADRLSFMFGFAATLDAVGKQDEAVKVFRQCLAFARSLYGPAAAEHALALLPLAAALLKTPGTEFEASQLADEAHDTLWKLGDARVVEVVPVRAEAIKAAGRADNPLAEFADLPDELAAQVASKVIAHRGEPVRTRAVLADLLKFVDRKFGDGHPAVADTLAAIACHEGSLGFRGDVKLRTTVTRRAVWSYAVRRASPDLLANLEVGFEADGTVHLGAHLSRYAGEDETNQLEDVLAAAVEDLWTRAKS